MKAWNAKNIPFYSHKLLFQRQSVSYVVDENTSALLKVNMSSLKLIFEPLRTWYVLVSNTKNQKVNQDGLR